MFTLFKIAFRDIVNSRAFTLFFILNLFLGLIGFATLSSFKENVENILSLRSKEILGADMAISARRDLDEVERNGLNKALADYDYQVIKTIETYSMVRSAQDKRSRLAQIKAVEELYPLYGHVEFAQGEAHESSLMQESDMQALQEEKFLWLDQDLAYQLRVEVGDQVFIGDLELVVANIVTNSAQAGQSSAALAPGLYLSHHSLSQTGLIAFGTVATYRYGIKFTDNTEVSTTLLEKVWQALPDPALTVRAAGQEGEQVGRVLAYLSDYLGLAGLAALLLSGIGAGYLFQNFLLERIEQVGVFKSLGMLPKSVAGIFFIQMAILSLVATLLANFFAWIMLPVIGSYLQSWVELPGELSLSFRTFFYSYMAAFGMSFFVCTPIFLKILFKKTINLFEGHQLVELKFKFKDYFLYVPLAVFIWGLAVFQSKSFIVGSLFCSALLSLVLVVAFFFPWMLRTLDKYFLKGVRPRVLSSLSLGIGLRFFARERFSSALSICALSIGVMLLSVIGQLDLALREELITSQTRPDFFIFDIQEEQAQALEEWGKNEDVDLSPLLPMIQARLKKINGQDVVRASDMANTGFTTREERREQRSRARTVNLSYASGLTESERLVEGSSFPGSFDPSNQELPYVSLEKRYAQRMGIKIGDTLVYEVLGLEIEAKVLNLRSVRWTNFTPNFFITFQPGVLEGAPKTYLSSIRSDSSIEKNSEQMNLQWETQDRLVEHFPNISVINVSSMISKALEVFNAMSKALMVMAILCMLIGVFVLFAIMQNQLTKRKYESALQKVMGVQARDLLKTLAFEYAAIIFCSFGVALFFTYFTTSVAGHVLFDGQTSFSWTYMLVLFLVVLLSAFSLVLFSSRRFYAMKIKSLLD